MATKFGGDPEVEADGFGMADVQVAVGLGREARDDAAAVEAGRHVGRNNFADEVPGFSAVARFGGRTGVHVRHGFQAIRLSQFAAQGAPARTARTISGLRPLRDRL